MDDLQLQMFETLIIHDMKTPGFIHKDKLKYFLDDMGIVLTAPEMIKFQNGFAPDSKGLIATSEIKKVVEPLLRRLNYEKLKDSISTFDRDKDGKLPMEDFDYAVTNFGKGMKEEDLKYIHELIGNTDPIDVDELAKVFMN